MNAYSGESFWFDALSEDVHPRPALAAHLDIDVGIIGAGFTGLWTAYYLKKLAPGLSIAVFEAETAGFGASGRNGGWLKGSMAGEDTYLAGLPSDLRRTGYELLHGIVDHVRDRIEQEGMACGFHKGGVLFAAARYPEQSVLLQRRLETLRRAGHHDADYQWLDRNELSNRVRMRHPQGAIFSPHCAVIDPARLVRSLARAVERMGVTIYEKTPVHSVGEGTIAAARGTAHAKTIVPALEGYSGSLPALRGYLLPVQSLIIATEPLAEALWDEIGLADRPAFSDAGRLITYGQRSEDGRLIFGARGSYQFGARPRNRFSLDDAEFHVRRRVMVDLFPMLQGVRVTHGWGGTMGMARTFAPHALFDPRTGIALAGGYGGGGVGASNLFARTLADLILGRDTDLVHMPWVIHGASPRKALRRWEPEPLPWLAYQAIQTAYSWEEALCRSAHTPAWRRKLAGCVSQALSRLLT